MSLLQRRTTQRDGAGARRIPEVVEIGEASLAEMLQKSPELFHGLSELLAKRAAGK